MFRRLVFCWVGTGSLPAEFRDSHEKAPVSFRVDGGGCVAAAVEGGAIVVVDDAPGLFAGDVPAGGDQGMEGRALAMLLSDKVLGGCSFSVDAFTGPAKGQLAW